MPMKKQRFHFRIPWISGPSTGSQSRPKQRSKSLNQLDTNTTIHRPPFRPPGITSTQPHPPPASAQSHGTPCSETQQLTHPPQSPASSVILESPMSSPSESPSRSSRPSPSPSHAGRASIIKDKVPTNPAAEESIWPHSEPKMKLAMKAPLETQSKSYQSKTKEKEKVVEKPIKARKTNDIKHGQSIQRPKTELHTTVTASTSRVNSKDKDAFHTKASEADTVTRNVTTISKEEKSPMQNDTKKDASNFDHKLATVNTTKLVDDKTVSVMTLAGENRGATMHVADSNTQSNRKKGSIHLHGGKTAGEENSSRTSTEKAYVNSNIQSMNNSFMLHGSITGRDPGVLVILPQQPQSDDDKLGFENPKAKTEMNINRAERVAYQPVVRRRCLRGLFMEPSDSDPDKPRRHGCKFSCGEVRKDNDTGIM